jgi:DNA/RNA endonuclease YhcR with UshA esterase domain
MMTKVLGFLAAALVAVGLATTARADVATDVAVQIQQSTMVQAAFMAGLNWKVGDKASYKLTNAILNGTVDSYVKEDTGTSYWFIQDMNLSMMGKQLMEILINKNTGKIEKLLVNGKEQAIPDNDQEIVETKGDHVRVPAGEFDCLYAKIKNKKDGSIAEAWLNMKLVPLAGMVKEIANSQVGQITEELTSMQFAPR